MSIRSKDSQNTYKNERKVGFDGIRYKRGPLVLHWEKNITKKVVRGFEVCKW